MSTYSIQLYSTEQNQLLLILLLVWQGIILVYVTVFFLLPTCSSLCLLFSMLPLSLLLCIPKLSAYLTNISDRHVAQCFKSWAIGMPLFILFLLTPHSFTALLELQKLECFMTCSGQLSYFAAVRRIRVIAPAHGFGDSKSPGMLIFQSP